MQSTYITFIVGMIAILNPIGNTAIYIGMVNDLKPSTQNKCALHCALAVSVILLFSLWFGKPLLSLFGISIGAFGSAGGLIVLLIAINMLRGQPHRPSYHTHIEEKTSSKVPQQSSTMKHQIAIVPLAIPIIAGPGAISKVIFQSYAFPALQDRLVNSAILMVLSFLIGVILYFAPLIGKALGEYGMKVVTRVMGLILAAIAMQMLCSNLTLLLPGLQ